MNARRSAQRIAWPIRKPSNAAGAPFGRNPKGRGRFGGIPLLPAAGSGLALRRGRRLGLLPKAPPSHMRQQARQAPRAVEAMPDPTNRRASYRCFLAVPTRWMDNDTYGHVNNVSFYSYFDTAVNEHLIRAGGLDIRAGPEIGLVVETSCRFHKPISFPDVIDAGMRVSRLGNP